MYCRSVSTVLIKSLNFFVLFIFFLVAIRDVSYFVFVLFLLDNFVFALLKYGVISRLGHFNNKVLTQINTA